MCKNQLLTLCCNYTLLLSTILGKLSFVVSNVQVVLFNYRVIFKPFDFTNWHVNVLLTEIY